MNPIIIAALLLLGTYSEEDYYAVIRYPIQAVYQPDYPAGGWTFCGDKTIYINLGVDADPTGVAATMAHEESHLSDYRFGCGPGKETKAMLRTLRVYQRVDAPMWRQEWARGWYWRFWHQEHPKHWSLGIIP